MNEDKTQDNPWRRAEEPPTETCEILICKRIRNPKTGVWHKSYIADRYHPEDGYVYENVIAWMPVPECPYEY